VAVEPPFVTNTASLQMDIGISEGPDRNPVMFVVTARLTGIAPLDTRRTCAAVGTLLHRVAASLWHAALRAVVLPVGGYLIFPCVRIAGSGEGYWTTLRPRGPGSTTQRAGISVLPAGSFPDGGPWEGRRHLRTTARRTRRPVDPLPVALPAAVPAPRTGAPQMLNRAVASDSTFTGACPALGSPECPTASL
jgi:hypothetical protein